MKTAKKPTPKKPVRKTAHKKRKSFKPSVDYAFRLLEDGTAYRLYLQTIERAREDVKDTPGYDFDRQFDRRFIEAITRTLNGVEGADDIDIFLVVKFIAYEFSDAYEQILQ